MSTLVPRMRTSVERPDWHRSASCRGDGRWFVDRLTKTTAEELRRICRACPVAGECLAEAISLEPVVRTGGVLRVGILGHRAWRRVESVVAELTPVTPADWTALASWIVDGDSDEVEVERVRRRPGVGRRVTAPARRLEPVIGGFPTCCNYDVTTASHAFTRAELVAARSA